MNRCSKRGVKVKKKKKNASVRKSSTCIFLFNTRARGQTAARDCALLAVAAAILEEADDGGVESRCTEELRDVPVEAESPVVVRVGWLIDALFHTL